MRITVKLYAMLRDYLPPGDDMHAREMEVADGATAEDVIKQLDLPAELVQLVMIDGVHLWPSEHESRVLKEGETVTIFPPVGGG